LEDARLSFLSGSYKINRVELSPEKRSLFGLLEKLRLEYDIYLVYQDGDKFS
jgi:hypothetical protein